MRVLHGGPEDDLPYISPISPLYLPYISPASPQARIDWMEMNQRATKLLFRDKRRALYLPYISPYISPISPYISPISPLVLLRDKRRALR